MFQVYSRSVKLKQNVWITMVKTGFEHIIQLVAVLDVQGECLYLL